MAGKFRGQTTWDPPLIIFQILTIQFLSYSTLTLLVLIATILSGYAPNCEHIFAAKMMRLGTARLTILAHITNAFISAYLLKIFVERSKACLDFSLTYYTIHFLLVWYYSRGLPDTFIWYFVNVISACIMCVTAEYLCRREEMKLIPISASV